ncbi:MAG: ABC transporter permease [Dehalococcoidia bacterium]|nr:ABC transporter permease [Dehalococcoidia bacterium]
MNKTLTIMTNEFLKTIRRISFIILTLALPLLGFASVGIYNLISLTGGGGDTTPSTEITAVGYVDNSGHFNDYHTQGNIVFELFNGEDAARQALLAGEISQYLVIPPDFIESGVIARYTTNKELEPPSYLFTALHGFTTTNLLGGAVPDEVIARILSSSGLATIQLDPNTGEPSEDQSSYINFIVPAIFSIFLVMALVFTSSYLLSSLGEEKENRVLEILVSSVSTRQLLAGKVLGMGAVGLLQVLVWIVSLVALIPLASSSFGGFLSGLQVPPYFWVLGVVYFILGYLVFAVLSAAVASISSSLQEASSISSIYTVMAVSPMWFVSMMLLHPDNPLWVALSIFPFTAPTMVLMRLGLTGVPGWQIAVSLTVLAASVAGGLVLASKLLRAYMLSYGKRPGLRQIWRSLRNS